MINCNTKESGAKLEGVIRADKSEIRSHVAERVRQSVEETLAEFYPEAAWQRCMVPPIPQRVDGRSQEQGEVGDRHAVPRKGSARGG